MDRRKFMTLLGLASSYPSLSLANTPLQELEKQLPGLATGSSAAPFSTPESGTQISLIACGGNGIAMTRQINKAAYGLHEIIAIDTDARALQEAANADKTILITTDDGQKPSNYLNARRRTHKQRGQIAEAIGRSRLVIVVAGLGGASGTGIAHVVNMKARDIGIQTRVFATVPSVRFGYDVTSADGFCGLLRYSHNILAFPIKLDSTVHRADSSGNEFLAVAAGLEKYLQNTCGSVMSCGYLGNNFEDMQSILDLGEFETDCPSSTIGWGEACGPERAVQAARNALNYPRLFILNEGEIRGISVAIRAHGGSLNLNEVNAVMSTVKDRCCGPDTPIIFSADYDDALDAQLQVSIILNRDVEPSREDV